MWVGGGEREKKKRKIMFRGKPPSTKRIWSRWREKKKHTAEPGVHPGNNNSLNNNDYKLLSGAER